MEEDNFKEAWAWLDEDFRLDTDSPLAISRSLWDDFTSSEGVVRSLFPVSHAEYSVSPSFSHEKTESSEHSGSWGTVPDCGPSPLKRRCVLQHYDDENLVNPTCYTSGSLENNNEYFVGTQEQLQTDDLSPSSSTWYIAAEESHSSVDDAMHQSAENWMVGCLSDSDTSEVVEIHPPRLIKSNVADSKILTRPTGVATRSRRLLKAAPLKVASPLSHPIQAKDVSDEALIKSHAHFNTDQGLPVNGSTRPVLAYPFALVKPSGIQGDVTLQDINQRIKMAPSAARSAVKSSFKSLASFSGKSVLALTKIQTEGKGTITILRTRS